MTPYYQYFGGYDLLQSDQPPAASDLVHFRNRIARKGVEKILKHSIELHGQRAREDKLSIDTRVQQNIFEDLIKAV